MSRVITCLLVVFACCSIIATISTSVAANDTTVYYIDPIKGNDTNGGTSPAKAFQSIQTGVDHAKAGDTIQLAAGTYNQNVLFKDRDGTASHPITLIGPPDAIVRGKAGDDNNRVIWISRDYITIQGFTIDGWRGPNDDRLGYNEQLIYIEGRDEGSAKPKDVFGVRVFNMKLKNALQECVRMRSRAKSGEIGNTTISNCGICDFRFGCTGNKNGEGIYIGTEPDQLVSRGTKDDSSNNNRIYGNTINTQGSECIDMKEGAAGTIVEGNDCTGSLDPKGGGIGIQGHGNIVRANLIYGHAGSGIRIAGDQLNDARNNEVYHNVIRDNRAGGIEFEDSQQGTICGNEMSNNTGGNAVGAQRSLFAPDVPCGSVVLSIVVRRQ